MNHPIPIFLSFFHRVGKGQVSSIVAVIGFFFGIVMTTNGLLNPVYTFLKGFTVELSGNSNLALWDVFGSGPLVKWLTIGIFSIVILAFVMKGKPTFTRNSMTYSWGLAGLLIGALTIIGWWVSSYFGGIPRGLAVTTPVRELFNAFLYKDSQSAIFPTFSFLGIFKGTWGAFFIFAVPLGSFLSAWRLKKFKWKIAPAQEILTVFFGSVIMGIGAVIAGGCNLGHGITGVSTMAVSSMVATASIILGNWTMVYFKFIKPMQ